MLYTFEILMGQGVINVDQSIINGYYVDENNIVNNEGLYHKK